MVCEMAIEDVLTCVDFIAAGVGLLLPYTVQPFIGFAWLGVKISSFVVFKLLNLFLISPLVSLNNQSIPLLISHTCYKSSDSGRLQC